MSRPGKVKAVGAHRFVLSPVRGGDAAAQRRSVLNAEAPVALISGGVILEHWRGKASKAGVLHRQKTEGGQSSPIRGENGGSNLSSDVRCSSDGC
jgi:hypothetical protein